MENNIEWLEFDLLVYKRQVKWCKEGIEKGNWEGYSENLKVRKEQLKILEEIVELLENKIRTHESNQQMVKQGR